MAVEKQARIGCKGKKKYWYRYYKEHVSVDMQSGLINKVATTTANLPDAQGLRHICSTPGAVYADKGYCTPWRLTSNGCWCWNLRWRAPERGRTMA